MFPLVPLPKRKGCSSSAKQLLFPLLLLACSPTFHNSALAVNRPRTHKRWSQPQERSQDVKRRAVNIPDRYNTLMIPERMSQLEESFVANPELWHRLNPTANVLEKEVGYVSEEKILRNLVTPKYSPSQIISGEAEKLYRQHKEKGVQEIVDKFERQRSLGITGLKDEHLAKLREMTLKCHSRIHRGRKEVKHIENTTINEMFQEMTREFEERSKAYNGNTDALMADLEGHRQALRDQREEQYKSIEAARLARERERDQVKPKEEEEETLKEGVRLPHLWETTEVPRHKNLLDVIRQQFGSKGGREQTYVNNTGSGRSEASLSADEAFRLLRKRQDISGLRVDNTTTQQVDRQQVECEESHSSGAQTCQLCCEEKIDNQNSSFCSCGYTTCNKCRGKLEAVGIVRCPACRNLISRSNKTQASFHPSTAPISIETISRPEDPVARPRGRIGGASSDDLIALSTQLLASLPSRVQPPKTSNRSCDPTEGEAISQVQPPHPPTGFQRPNRSDNGGEKEEVSRNLPRNPPPPLDVAGDQRNASGGIESGTTGREEVNEAACRKSVAERLLGFTDAKRQGGGKEFNPETVGEVEGDEEMDGETRHKRELLRKHLNTDPGFILPELKGFPCRAEVLKMRRTELLDVVYTWPTILDLKSVHMISTSNLKDRILTFLGEKARQFLQPESKRVSPSRTDVQARRDGGSDKRGKEPVKEPTPPEVQAPCDLTSLPTASLFDMGGLQKGAKAKKGRALLQDLWDKD